MFITKHGLVKKIGSLQWTLQSYQNTNLNEIKAPSIGLAYNDCENYPSECTAYWGTLVTLGAYDNYKNQMLFDYNGQIFVRNQGSSENMFCNWKQLSFA